MIVNWIFNLFFDVKFRVENFKKFKNEDGDCFILVCIDLVVRGLDLDVDYVIMFDFFRNFVSFNYFLMFLYIVDFFLFL